MGGYMYTTFDDIAGYTQEKIEMKNIVEMFNNFEVYKTKGISVPKGLLFYGRPGVGKTLFVKAIANELKHNFFEVDIQTKSTDKIIEQLKDVFKLAKANKPSIVFIDELDKIIPNERIGASFVTDNTREILNYLLQTLDGIGSSGEMMVIATSNQVKSMNQALIRSGRFDKHVYLSLPDETSRKAILEYYLNKVEYPKDISIKQIVASTEGFSGADIKTIVNLSFIDAIAKKKDVVTTIDLIEQIYINQGQSLIKDISEADSKVVAVHELGHTIVAHHLGREITDLAIGQIGQSMGRVHLKALEDLDTKEDILDEVTILLGGKAAEEVMLNKTCLGSRSDIESAYHLLQESLSSGDFGFEFISFESRVLARTSDKANEEIASKLETCYQYAKDIIKLYEKDIELLIPKAIQNKILTQDELVIELHPLKQIYNRLQ